MNSPNDRKVVLALLTIFMVCLIGLGASLYRAKAAELRNLKAELKKKTVERDEVKAKIEHMPELEAQYAQVRARLAILEPALPDSAYIPTFLRQIEELAVGTDNRIVSIRPKPEIEPGKTHSNQVQINEVTGELVEGKKGEPAEEDETALAEKKPKLPYRFIPIEFKIGGTYWTSVDFLRELQRFKKMIAVNNISFQPEHTSERRQGPEALTTTMDMLAVVTTTKGQADGTAQPK